MRNLLLFLPLFFFTISCHVACDVEKVVSSKLAGVVASPALLNCANQAQIQKDIDSVLGFTQLCAVRDARKGAPEGAIAAVVCPIVVSTAVSYLGNQVPVSWQCQPANGTQSLTAVLTTACSLLPF